MADPNLDRFLKAAGISPGARQLYFSGCTLLPGWQITVPDADVLGYIEAHFGDRLRAVRPVRLSVTAAAAPAKAPGYLNAKGRAAWALTHAKQDKLV